MVIRPIIFCTLSRLIHVEICPSKARLQTLDFEASQLEPYSRGGGGRQSVQKSMGERFIINIPAGAETVLGLEGAYFQSFDFSFRQSTAITGAGESFYLCPANTTQNP